MTSPIDQVFQTTELLTLVLSHLDMRSLLAAQRVSYLWNNVVRTTSTTQKTLFLQSDHEVSSSGYSITNPLYMQRFIQQAAFHSLRDLNPEVTFMGMDRFVVKRVDWFAEADASWKRMLLFQPPVKMAYLKPMSAHLEEPERFSYLKRESGLTMGDVVEFFKAKAMEGDKAVNLLSKTVTRKVVWIITPVSEVWE